MNIFSTDNIVQIGLPFLALILTFVALIISLDIVWRAEKHLKSFASLLSMAVVVLIIQESSIALGMDSNDYWHIMTIVIDIILGFLFLASFVHLYKIVRKLDSEDPNTKLQ